MKYIPKGASRFLNHSLLKVKKNSPTLLVVGGVVGLGVTAVVAAKATRKIDPIIKVHNIRRSDIPADAENRAKMLFKLYMDTGIELTKVYAPALALGVTSAACVLGGHSILNRRHVATMAAYSGLFDQFNAYRGRVAKTLGEDAERDIYNGAHGVYKEDPDHKGEYKMEPEYDGDDTHYAQFAFDARNPNWTSSPEMNYNFLKGVQSHMNNLLSSRKYIFLSEVLDALGYERTPESIPTGWMYEDTGEGDGYVDFGFMNSNDPETIAFRNKQRCDVMLNFNVDGLIWDKI